MKIILASTSPYRRELLARLTDLFSTCRPEVDEALLPGEEPAARALRLAAAKAQAVAADHPDSLVIGSDQVAWRPTSEGFEIFRKPGSAARAIDQLMTMRGKSVFFHTAVCLLNTSTGHTQRDHVTTEVRFRDLSEAEITRYVAREKPVDCAGAAKVESLGISLLEYVRDDDPTALIGLPLIKLSAMLRQAGVSVP
ncbi:MAG: hypothetical protein RIR70_1967 [Pseudomonadota bacterium]|jgi:septum formation protein